MKTKKIPLALLLLGLSATGALAQSERKTAQKSKETISYEELVTRHNFPVNQNTGNAELDYQNYAEAKQKWISENKALYTRYTSQGKKGNPQQRKESNKGLTPAN